MYEQINEKLKKLVIKYSFQILFEHLKGRIFPLPEVAGFWHPQLSRWASAKNLVVQSHVNKSGNKSLYVEI